MVGWKDLEDLNWPEVLSEQVERCSNCVRTYLDKLHRFQTGSRLECDMSEVRSSIWFMAWFVQFSELELGQLLLLPEFAGWIMGVSEVSQTFELLSSFVREI